MKGKMHKLWKSPAAKTHSVASSYKNRPVREIVGPPKPAAIAERIERADQIDTKPPTRLWTIMHTGPRQELAAVAELKRDGYAAYCPVVTKWVRTGRVRQIRHTPLFPRYIFVGLKEGASKALSSCTWGRPLTLDNGNVPLMTGKLIYGISDMQAAGVWDEAKDIAIREAARSRVARKASAHFNEGQEVHVDSDLWEGLTATVLHAGDDERVVILMKLFGRESKVTVTLDQIRPAA